MVDVLKIKLRCSIDALNEQEIAGVTAAAGVDKDKLWNRRKA